MKHPESELLDWLDHTLPVDRAAVVAAHLARCATCRATVERLTALEQQLQTLPLLLPTHDFAAQVEQRIALLPPQPARIRWTTPLAVAVLGFLVILPSFATLFDQFALPRLDWTLLLEIDHWLPWLNELSGQLEATLVLGLCAITLACVLVVVQTLSVRPAFGPVHSKVA